MTVPASWSKVYVELEQLATRLERKKNLNKTGEALTIAAKSARAVSHITHKDQTDGALYRRMKLDHIPVPLPANKALHPHGCELTSASVSILFECWDDLPSNPVFGSEALDRIRRADMQVRVQGRVSYGDREVIVEDHWRIDTHHFSDPSVDPHPWIHYQRGGHAQDTFVKSDGFLPGSCLKDSVFENDIALSGLMQTPAPRIATPPLDPLCAIDFVVAQHSGAVWSSLWEDPDYAAHVRRAQERLWDPWFEAASNRRRRKHVMPFYATPKPLSA